MCLTSRRTTKKGGDKKEHKSKKPQKRGDQNQKKAKNIHERGLELQPGKGVVRGQTRGKKNPANETGGNAITSNQAQEGNPNLQVRVTGGINAVVFHCYMITKNGKWRWEGLAKTTEDVYCTRKTSRGKKRLGAEKAMGIDFKTGSTRKRPQKEVQPTTGMKRVSPERN